ncbi:HYR domain-containing protein, partial [Winogradskyella tangerina]|uniref:HYR domain-containing protein n=1 Tax=Winogradskyella tangerina TaxID=2023240 RepID=UPI000DF26B47
VNYNVPFADNCPGSTIAQTAGIASGGTFPIGTTTNSFTVTDAAGNTTSCSFTVTVIDNEDPTITCPANITVNNDNGVCGADVNYNVPFADNCPGSTIAQTAGIASGGTFPIGTTTNSFTVTDAAGNTTSCSFTVTVIDNEDPTITCPANITVNNDSGVCGADVNYNVPFADNCPGSTIAQTAGIASGGTFPIGTTTNSFTVTDAAGNTTSCSFTVTVIDNEDPTITCPSDIVIGTSGVDCSEIVTYNVTGNDNCSGYTLSQTAGLPSGSAFPVGTTTNSFTITDAYGNTTSCSFNITVNDDTPPTATCQDITVSLDSTGNVTVAASAVDNGSNDNCGVQSMTISPSTFTCSDIGNNTVTFTVTDTSGNTDTCTATITIQDTTAPDASCGSISVVLSATTGTYTLSQAEIDSLYLGTGDTCGNVSVSITQSSFDCNDIGINNLTLTITDPSGNTSNCSAEITVDAPTIMTGSLTGTQIDPLPANPVPADDLIEVSACPNGILEPKDFQLTLDLSGSNITTAQIQIWQTSDDNGETWIDVGGTANQATINLIDITMTTIVRVVLQSGNCIEYSPLAVIRFLPPDIPPNIVSVSSTDICLGDSVNIEAESYFETVGSGQFGEGGLFNNANPDDWLVDGIEFLPAPGNNSNPGSWYETNGPKLLSGIRYDTSDNTKFAVAHGIFDTTLETPIFNTVGMDAADAILQFHTAYYFCNGAWGDIRLSLDGGATYDIVLSTIQGDNFTTGNNSGVQVINVSNSCGGGPQGQHPTSDELQLAQIDLSAYIGMANLRVKFSYWGGSSTECEDENFPAHPNNTCNNIPSTFDVFSSWVIDDVGFPLTPVDNEDLQWTDENGVVVATGNNVTVTPTYPGIREYGVTTLINGCRADGDDATEFININTSLAYAGIDYTPVSGDCGQSVFNLKAYDNTQTFVQNYNDGAWESGLYPAPTGGETEYLGTGVTGTWSINPVSYSGCGNSAVLSSITNPRATFTADPGTYILRWTLSNGCFDEVTITINSCSNIDFDGVDDFITLRNNYAFDSSFTLETWIKSNNATGNKTVFSKRNVNVTNAGYNLNVENGVVKFYWYSTAGNGVISSQYNIDTSRWYHIAVTFNGSEYRLYIDGIDVGQVTGSVNAPEATTNDVEALIGAIDEDIGSNNNVGNFFNGWIDEVRIWNQALTVDQIRMMMNQEINDNTAIIGEVVPLDVPGLNWSNLDGYYRMSVGCGNLNAFKGVSGRLRNMNSTQDDTAPLPYTSRIDGQLWSTDNTWTNFNVWDPPNSIGIDGSTSIDWNIVQISHNINSGNKDISVLGLISDTSGKELAIYNPNETNDESNSGQGLSVSHYLRLDGYIDLVGESQLIQGEGSILDSSSSGYLERDQQGTTNLYNYNFWSSPVSPINTSTNNSNYTVNGVFRDGTNSNNPLNIQWTNSYDANGSTTPKTLSRRWLYVYENYPADTYADWRYLTETGNLPVGLGYTMKGSGATGTNQNYVYIGKPNNGTITTPVTIGNQALVGNPYASAIDANEFILDNIPGGNTGTSSSIDGTLYYWEHYPSNFTHILEDYEGGYATYNLTGGNPAVSPPLVSGNGTPTKIPGRYVPVAQGFYITASNTGGNVTFNNDQRQFVREAVNNSVFIRASQEYTSNYQVDDGALDDIKRVRINFTNPDGAVRPLLLGFIENSSATDDYDHGYDAEETELLNNDMLWMVNDILCSTQGVGAFDTTRQLPLGLFMTTSGTIQISLFQLENFEEDIDVFIYDSLLNIYHQINDENFEMTINEGDYINRFYLTFQEDSTLSDDTFQKDRIEINYLSDSHNIFIESINILSIKNIELYNVLGQKVKTWSSNSFELDINSISIPVTDISEGTYIVKVYDNERVYHKKILISL